MGALPGPPDTLHPGPDPALQPEVLALGGVLLVMSLCGAGPTLWFPP